MRQKYILLSLLLVLAGLVAARALTPEPAVSVWSSDAAEYNVLELDLPREPETAGSAMIGEMNAYFLGRAPTAKHALTGALRGKNLLLICADEWTPDPGDRGKNPSLYRLAAGSAALSQVWRPDWYQGEDGRLFALLTGMVPTRVRDETALTYAGEQSVYLPFALARSFTRAGYGCAAVLPEGYNAAALTALGFGEVCMPDGGAEDAVPSLLAALEADEAPALLFCRWTGDGEAALTELLEALLAGERREDTALCLLTGDQNPERAQLYFWGAGLSGAAAEIPVSELDVTPTLLNLFGLEYDARFLSGRDIFAPTGGAGNVSAVTPLVTLGGSAFAGWVTDAGRYDPAAEDFQPAETALRRSEQTAYIQAVCRLNYDRYIFARRVMETNYFHLAFGGRE